MGEQRPFASRHSADVAERYYGVEVTLDENADQKVVIGFVSRKQALLVQELLRHAAWIELVAISGEGHDR